MQKRKVQIAENKYLDVKKNERIPFSEMAKLYLEAYSKPNKRSSWRDEISVKHLESFFGRRSLYTITPLDVEQYKKKRVNEVSSATTNRELACLKHIFTKANEWGKIEGNPIASVKLFKVREGRIRYLEKEEMAKLIDTCPSYMKPMVISALNTGMRKGEIFNLKWNDIDFRKRIIYVLVTKNNEVRKIPVNDITFKTLLRVRKNPRSPYVFCKNNGEPYKDIRGGFNAALKRAGIKEFRFHDLRHTFASHLAMAGVDLKTVQELLGHKTFAMTLRYSHLSPDHKRQAMDILGRRMDTNWTPTRKLKETLPVELISELSNNEHEEDYAGVVELADTLDSKSSEAYPSCGFKSHLRHQIRISYLVARISQTKHKTLLKN